jgi:hypothetical protein
MTKLVTGLTLRRKITIYTRNSFIVRAENLNFELTAASSDCHLKLFFEFVKQDGHYGHQRDVQIKPYKNI